MFLFYKLLSFHLFHVFFSFLCFSSLLSHLVSSTYCLLTLQIVSKLTLVFLFSLAVVFPLVLLFRILFSFISKYYTALGYILRQFLDSISDHHLLTVSCSISYSCWTHNLLIIWDLLVMS